MINKFNYILLAAGIAILLIIIINTDNNTVIDQKILKSIELEQSKTYQEKIERQYFNLIIFQQVGYLLSIMLIPLGFSVYKNRTTLKRFKRNLDKAFKLPSTIKRKTLVEQLILNYPDLTSYEVKLCILVYKGLSSKEIACELNISTSSANTARYRLRKKLNISSGEDLRSFLHKI